MSVSRLVGTPNEERRTRSDANMVVEGAFDRVRGMARQQLMREESTRYLEQEGAGPEHLARSESFQMLRQEFPTAPERKIKELEVAILRDGQCLVDEDSSTVSFVRFIRSEVGCFERRYRSRVLKRTRSFSGTEIVLLLFLALTLLLAAPARGHLNPLAGLIISTDEQLNYTIGKHGQLLYFAVIATAIGRLITGFVIDMSHPLVVLGVLAAGSAGSVMLISQFHSITTGFDDMTKLRLLRTFNAMNAFFQSGIFASAIKYVHDQFRPSQWGVSLIIIAIGQKLGVIISVLSMGSIVTSMGRWEQGSLIAASMCFAALIPLLVVCAFPHPVTHLVAPSEPEPLNPERNSVAFGPSNGERRIFSKKSCCSLKCDAETRARKYKHFKFGVKRIVYWWQRPPFVLMAIANAGMAVTISPEGFDGLAPLFTNKALHTTAGIPTGSVMIFFEIGGICSLVFGAVYLENLARPFQARTNLFLMLVASAALGGLIALTSKAYQTDLSIDYSTQARVVYFFVGLGMGYPYFVTVPKFAINFGGDHSALVVQILGLFALGVCAGANSIFGVLASSSWMFVVAVVFALSLVALISMMLFDFYEWKTKSFAKRNHIHHAVAELVSAEAPDRGGDVESGHASPLARTHDSPDADTHVCPVAQSVQPIQASTNESFPTNLKSLESEVAQAGLRKSNSKRYYSSRHTIGNLDEGSPPVRLSRDDQAATPDQSDELEGRSNMTGTAELDAEAEEEPGAHGKTEDAKGNEQFEAKPVRACFAFLLVITVVAAMFASYYWSKVRI